jgi:hypothetical protein
MRKAWILAGTVLIASGCTDRKSLTAATAIAGPTPTVSTPALPTAVAGVLTLGLPIDSADLANTAFGLAPFGYHGADHADDGHPGWDIEYRLGGIVRAAAAGTVQSVFPDAFTPGRFTVQLEHVVGTHHYRTVYTNLANVNAGIAPTEVVQSGQPLGTAGTVSGSIGTTQFSYAMTHFQLDDFEFYRDVPNPNAVSPEPFLSADSQSLFDRIWSTAAFVHELVEPFITNPRDQLFPASRTWTRAGGDGPAGIRFTRRSARAAEYDYALLAESGTIVEAGTVVLTTTSRPLSSIDLVSPTSSRRLGVYDIVSNELRLSLAEPGASRPTALSSANIYRTTR